MSACAWAGDTDAPLTGIRATTAPRPRACICTDGWRHLPQQDCRRCGGTGAAGVRERVLWLLGTVAPLTVSQLVRGIGSEYSSATVRQTVCRLHLSGNLQRVRASGLQRHRGRCLVGAYQLAAL